MCKQLNIAVKTKKHVIGPRAYIKFNLVKTEIQAGLEIRPSFLKVKIISLLLKKTSQLS